MPIDPNSNLTLTSLQPNDLLEVYHEKHLHNIRADSLALQQFPFYNVKNYGTSGNGTGDDTDAINAAIAAAGENGTIYFPNGTYITSETITFDCNVMSAPYANILSSTSPAIIIENSNSQIPNKINIPRLTNSVTPYWSDGNLGSTIGVEIRSIYNSEISIPYVTQFTEGVKLVSSANKGVSYNKFNIGLLVNNVINLSILPIASGWVNENWFFGGHYQHTSEKGTNVTGTFHIKINCNTNPISIPNNNSFFGASVEGSVAQYAIWCLGRSNQFHAPRFDSVNIGLHWASDGTNHARGNIVFGGFGINTVEITTDSPTNVYGNTVYGTDRSYLSGASVAGLYQMQNLASSGYPAITVISPGVDLINDDLTSKWSGTWSANEFKGKVYSHSEANLLLDLVNGRIGLGPGGSTAISSYIDYNAANDSFTSNKEVELTESGDGIILHSPDGTAYRLTVANGGTTSVSAV